MWHHAKCKPYYPRSSTSPLRLILAFSPVNDRNWASIHQQTAERESNTELQNYIESQKNCWQNTRQGTGICRHQDLLKTDHVFSFILLAILGVIKVLQYWPLNLYQLTQEKALSMETSLFWYPLDRQEEIRKASQLSSNATFLGVWYFAQEAQQSMIRVVL